MSQTDSTPPVPPADTGVADTEKIMAAIASCQATLLTKIEDLQSDFTHLHQDIDKIKDWTTEVERRVGMVEDSAHTINTSIHTLQQQVKTLFLSQLHC